MKNFKMNGLGKKLTMLAVGTCFTAMSIVPAFAAPHDKKPEPPQKPIAGHHQQIKNCNHKVYVENCKSCKQMKPGNKPCKPSHHHSNK